MIGQGSERDCLFGVEVETEIIMSTISLIGHHPSRSLVIDGSNLGQKAAFFIPRRRKCLVGCSGGLEEAFRIILKPHVELKVLRIVRDV